MLFPLLTLQAVWPPLSLIGLNKSSGTIFYKVLMWIILVHCVQLSLSSLFLDSQGSPDLGK